MATNHALDHNKVAAALEDLVEVLGADPSGAYADLTSRLADALLSETDVADTVGTDGPLDAALSASIVATTATGVSGVCIGDSISNRNGPYLTATGETDQRYYPQIGFFNHARVALGQRVYLSNNFAVSGKRSDEVLADQVPQVLALDPKPSFCTVLAGVNDIQQGKSAAWVIDALGDIYDALADAGILVIAGTVMPASVINTGGEIAAWYAVNQWIKAQGLTRKRFHVVDFAAPLCATDGTPKTNALADESGTFLHPTALAAALMGARLAPVLATLFPPVDPFPTPGDPASIGPGPFMVGTGGSKGTGITGNVATGWTLQPIGTATAVGSKVARTDGLPGEWQQIAVSAGDVSLQNDAWYTVTAGDQYKALVEFQADAGVTVTRFDCVITPDGFAAHSAGALLRSPSGDTDPLVAWPLPTTGVLETPTLTVPSGTVHGDVYIRTYGLTGGNIRIGRVALVKVI